MKSFQFIDNYSDEAFLSNSRGILNNCLTNILHINKNETDVNVQQIRRRLSYYDFDQFTKLAKEKNLNVLSAYIQFLNAKFSELES